MDVDEVLAMRPAPVEDGSFSELVALRLYRERTRRRETLMATIVGMLVILLASLPIRDLPQEVFRALTGIASTPYAPVLAGTTLLILLARPARLVRS